MSRRKGKVGEREVVALAKREPDLFPDARRGINQGRSGVEVPDVILDDEHWAEVKRQKSPSLLAALRQAVVDSEGSGRTPIAVCRDDGDRMGWTVTLRWDDWVELVRAKKTLDSVCVRTGIAVEAEFEAAPVVPLLPPHEEAEAAE